MMFLQNCSAGVKQQSLTQTEKDEPEENVRHSLTVSY